MGKVYVINLYSITIYDSIKTSKSCSAPLSPSFFLNNAHFCLQSNLAIIFVLKKFNKFSSTEKKHHIINLIVGHVLFSMST